MTGIGSPYEEPLHPEMVLVAEGYTVNQCAEKLVSFLRERNYLQPPKVIDSDREIPGPNVES